MKKVELATKTQSFIAKVGFGLKKHSPELLLAGGIAGLVVTVVVACKATLKIPDILEKAKEDVDEVKELANEPLIDENEEELESDYKRELTRVYILTGWQFVKLYAPAVIIGTASVVSVLASHNVMKKRSAALTAAYVAVDEGFKKYRDRVKDKFGEEVDQELRYGLKTEKIEEGVTDVETGKEKKVKVAKKVVDEEGLSEYARVFDELCPDWSKNAEHNLYFVKEIQNWANQRLRTRGYLFLNEVYNKLGLPPSTAGQVVGWLWRPGDSNLANKVDFGISNEAFYRRFMNGYEPCIVLDFNVDGPIMYIFGEYMKMEHIGFGD